MLQPSLAAFLAASRFVVGLSSPNNSTSPDRGAMTSAAEIRAQIQHGESNPLLHVVFQIEIYTRALSVVAFSSYLPSHTPNCSPQHAWA